MKHYTFLDLKTVNAPFMAELQAAATRVIQSGCYIGHGEVEDFERELAAMTGVDHAVGVGNGLDALRLIFRAYMELGRLKPGDEVIVPSNSFVASALAVTECGLTARFAEVDPHTMNIDWNNLPLSSRTRAILPVHLYGRVCEIPAGIKEEYIVVEDNAQAIGAEADGVRTGAMGHAAGMSFYPTKNVGALGDAGAVTTNDAELANVVRMLRNYGTDRPYNNVYAGVNSRLDPIQAAMLRVKLPHTAAENALRQSNAEIYDAEIVNTAVIKPFLPASAGSHVWYQYVLRVPGCREEFRRFLAERGVETAVHYPVPIHLQPCYRREYGELSLPVAERLAAEVVSLPVSRCTSPDDARAIASIVNEFN